MALFIDLVENAKVVTFEGEPIVEDVATKLQDEAENHHCAIITIFDGMPFMALPGGSAQTMVHLYFEALEFMKRERYSNFLNGGNTLNRLPKYPIWIRSVLLPGEKL